MINFVCKNGYYGCRNFAMDADSFCWWCLQNEKLKHENERLEKALDVVCTQMREAEAREGELWELLQDLIEYIPNIEHRNAMIGVYLPTLLIEKARQVLSRPRPAILARLERMEKENERLENNTQALAEKAAQMAEAEKALIKLVSALDDLIGESQGVYGLHLNGDPSPWAELLPGGTFEEWLSALTDARQALEVTPDD